MLPRASPVKRSWASMEEEGSTRDAARGARSARLLHRDGNDLALLPGDQDVIVLRQRVVLVGGEGPPVGLDEAAVLALEILERRLDLRALGGAGLLDGEPDQMHGVVGVGGADGRQDVLGPLDPVLGLQRRDYPLADFALLAEEAVGLHEH